MTLQGFLQAEEYGSSATIIGGMGLTMSVWQERIRTGWFSKTTATSLPRVIVQAALRETALHPGLHAIPRLRTILNGHQRVWDTFREKDIRWLLVHADLIGAIHSDPTARLIWTHWYQRLNYSESVLAKARSDQCLIHLVDSCRKIDTDVKRYTSQVVVAARAVAQWGRILALDRRVSVSEWWAATHSTAPVFDTFADSLARLHDIVVPSDSRITHLEIEVQNITNTLARDTWTKQVLASLLTGKIWSACLEHVRLREGRVRELMVVAGVQDLVNAHERILNASLRAVAKEDHRNVQEWFGEMSGYGWWMSEEVPSLVRRCTSQEAGDCTRIGPTEIIALTERFAERSKIVRDWNRRVLIGMWNALPIIAILFVLEFILLFVGSRQTVVLKLDDSQPLAPATNTLTTGTLTTAR